MSEFHPRIAVGWHLTLERVLAEARRTGPKGVLVFDLDSTVFDNRPRQARIVREYGAAKGLASLMSCQPFHFTSGWDLKAAAIGAGMSSAEAESHYAELKKFWVERFFTSEYCRDDIEIVGAPRYLVACTLTQAQVVYCTGRHEAMREGTIAALAKCGMPLPGGSVKLLMKPKLRDDDDSYKRVAHALIGELGSVIAAFDNEPTHINDYASQFPHAILVHLATDHSGREVRVDPRVVSIPHFAW